MNMRVSGIQGQDSQLKTGTTTHPQYICMLSVRVHVYQYAHIYKYFSISIYIAGCLALLWPNASVYAGFGVAEI